MDNPYLRCVRVSGSGPGLTTLPTLSAVGGRSRFGALRTATALRGFFIYDSFWVGPWKCGQSFPALSPGPRSGLGLPTFPQPHPAAAAAGAGLASALLRRTDVIRFAPPRRRPSPRSATGTQYHSRNTEGTWRDIRSAFSLSGPTRTRSMKPREVSARPTKVYAETWPDWH